MGTINIASFGGLEYGVPKRELSEFGAQVSKNLQVRSASFTPLREDGAPFNLSAVGSGGIGLGTISAGTVIRTMFRYPYRNTGATTILGSDKVVDVVKGQLKDDTYERCYLADDGTVGTQLPPYVIYGGASPTARLLGVPAPTTQMGASAVGVAQLTPAHLANVQAQNEAIVFQNLELMLNKTWGGTAASASTPGYLDNLALSDGVATAYGMQGDKPNQSRIFGVDGAGLTFSSLGPEYFTWALGVPFTTHKFTADHETTLPTGWGSLGTGVAEDGNFAAITYPNFYRVYSFGSGTTETAARNAIKAIVQPGLAAPNYLITAPQLAALEARITPLFDVAGTEVAPYIARINFRRLLLTQLMDGQIGSTALNNLNSFLTTNTAVQTRINTAYDAFATAVWDKMNKAYTTPANATTSYTGTAYTASAVFSPTRATSLPLIIAAVKARLTGDGTSAVSPYVSIRSISKANAFLNLDKLGLYTFAATTSQDAVFQASQTLDFTAELQKLYDATTLEAMKEGVPEIPSIFVSGGETTAEAVIGAKNLLALAISDLENYYLTLPDKIKLIIKTFFREQGLNELHADVDPTGGQVFETRYYTHTYVNDWGEESQDWAHAAGELPTEIEVDQNDTVTLTLTGSVPSGYGITKWRIYRSNSASDATRYQLVGEEVVGTTTFVDDKTNVQLQEPLATETWAKPPTETVSGTLTYLQGLVNLPGNFLAGYIDRTVYFSEVGAYYAWPLDYAIPMAHKIVGMEVFGNTLVVLTEGGPQYLVGSDPAAMSPNDPESNEACLSKRSIAKVTGGVIFASPNGLCLASGAGVQVFLPAPLGKAYWAQFRPDLMQCAEYDGVLYVAAGPYYDSEPGGEVTNPDTGSAYPDGQWQRTIGINLATMKITSLDLLVTAWYSDRTTDTLYAALPHDGAAPQAKQILGAATPRKGTWRSKRVTLPMEDGFAWVQVMGEQSTASGYGALIKLYGYVTKSDGTEVETTLCNTTITNTNPVRVAAGRFLEFEIELSSKAQIKNIIFAGSLEDLQGAT